jgi:hypothetical protein
MQELPVDAGIPTKAQVQRPELLPASWAATLSPPLEPAAAR